MSQPTMVRVGVPKRGSRGSGIFPGCSSVADALLPAAAARTSQPSKNPLLGSAHSVVCPTSTTVLTRASTPVTLRPHSVTVDDTTYLPVPAWRCECLYGGRHKGSGLDLWLVVRANVKNNESNSPQAHFSELFVICCARVTKLPVLGFGSSVHTRAKKTQAIQKNCNRVHTHAHRLQQTGNRELRTRRYCP
jgi:hypothetical protein